MDKPRFPDKYDWRGCEAVQFDPLKLSGRATVENTRMDADAILAFAAAKGLKAIA
jgi:hypothetical protein